MSMNRDDFEREAKYESRMALARTMLRKGIITEDEYAEIDTNFLSKYRPVLGSLRAAKMPD
jgi:transcription initiation factor IIE alpha subunit